ESDCLVAEEIRLASEAEVDHTELREPTDFRENAGHLPEFRLAVHRLDAEGAPFVDVPHTALRRVELDPERPRETGTVAAPGRAPAVGRAAPGLSARPPSAGPGRGPRPRRTADRARCTAARRSSTARLRSRRESRPSWAAIHVPAAIKGLRLRTDSRREPIRPCRPIGP